MNERTTLSRDIGRLQNLVGTDPGFYILALHSFVESHVRRVCTRVRYIDSFPEAIWQFGDDLKGRPGIELRELSTLTRIAKEHRLTNSVRHRFQEVDVEEARAATHNFLKFCALCNITDDGLDAISSFLDEWEQRFSPIEQSRVLRKLKFDLFIAQRDNKRLLGQLTEYESAMSDTTDHNAEIARLTEALDQETQRSVQRKERITELRQKLHQSISSKEEQAEILEKYTELSQYIEYLQRFSIYTRTRLDYERSLMKLTPEQQSISDEVKEGHHFLIRGAAGTGKTIVLLHTLDRIVSDQAAELDLDLKGRSVLLTYTNALVKFDAYLVQLMRMSGDAFEISTADLFFARLLKTIKPDASIDYNFMKSMCTELNNTDSLSDEELEVEIEGFLFGSNVTKNEYVDEVIPRRGMRHRLSVADRRRVWEIRDQTILRMTAKKLYSKNYSRLIIQQCLDAGELPDSWIGVDFIFIDEAQDLYPIELSVLSGLAGRSLVMAGHADQTIYGVGSPYRRAGIDIAGRSRILRTNFRNTCTIHDLAELYRRQTGAGKYDESSIPRAFREGPVPELYVDPSPEALLEILIKKVGLFINTLNYDPENIAVLAPTHREIDAVVESLKEAGYACKDLRDAEFSFADEGVVRVSTLHSSKGVDFPVVLLYLPRISAGRHYNLETAETLQRNLIYVAMTRAMDNLNIFVKSGADESPLQELIRVYNEFREGVVGSAL